MSHPSSRSNPLFGALLLAGTVSVPGAASAADPVPYPDGYRDWHHVKSMVILPGHPLENPFAGIHHIYANPAAADGLRTGRYADGAVFVFDLLEADSGGNAVQEGPRKLIGVMHYDRDDYAATGGWGFEGFASDTTDQRLAGDGSSCYGCHTSQADNAYVFTRARD